MNGKVYTVKPGVSYRASTRREKTEERVSLKERVLDFLETGLMILLLSVFLFLSVAVAYKSLVYFKIKMDRRALSSEKVQLEKELSQLTSREVLVEKAKALGLRPPQEKDEIRLK